jgi:hypothetical protein
MPGLVPGIHVLLLLVLQNVDGRDEPGHDEWSSDERRRVPERAFLQEFKNSAAL